MSYRMGLMDDYRSERFITFSEASEILGIRSYSRVSKMVKAGTLAAFGLPDTDRLRVRKSEVMALIRKSDANKNG